MSKKTRIFVTVVLAATLLLAIYGKIQNERNENLGDYQPLKAPAIQKK